MEKSLVSYLIISNPESVESLTFHKPGIPMADYTRLDGGLMMVMVVVNRGVTERSLLSSPSHSALGLGNSYVASSSVVA